ncbi:MAG: c-type cytochrome [Verrucomicrobiales bacterium]|nr:c-type cytochrome [Verrucomicrobiales bacterium]
MKKFVFPIPVVSLLLLLGSCSEPENIDSPSSPSTAPEPVDWSSVGQGEVYQKVCSTCHGPEGEGNPQIQSPAIGGLPAWYVKEQTGKFKSGLRGAHPEDTQGQLMRAIAIALTPQQLDEAAQHVGKLPERKTEQHGDKASVDRGRRIFANECMQCHRYNGRGEVVFHSAPLTTLDRDYLVRQLKKYRKGWRGNDKSDFYGHKMVEMAGTLTDESIEDVVNFIGSLAHGDDPRPAADF